MAASAEVEARPDETHVALGAVRGVGTDPGGRTTSPTEPSRRTPKEASPAASKDERGSTPPRAWDGSAPATSALKGSAVDGPFVGERPMLMRDARRLWMRGRAGRAPPAVLIVSLHARQFTEVSQLPRTHRAIRDALERVGPTYATGLCTLALLLEVSPPHRADRVAEAVRDTLERSFAAEGREGIRIACGIAALRRGDDPTVAVCIAEDCLRLAQSGMDPIVSEASMPDARRHAA
ncbi:hypothetical protein [Acuticoccus sp.]|uniref:hypothetical protein n=1 Tax=Acuticoccus sp. TaxID=1904378 RepID=UPI003B526A52